MPEMISIEQLAQHKSKDSLWIAVEGKVYDVTKFQTRHPGGAGILNKVGGTDATRHFLKFHPPSVLRMLAESECVGELEQQPQDSPAVGSSATAAPPSGSSASAAPAAGSSAAGPAAAAVPSSSGIPSPDLALNAQNKPDLGEIYNLFDFEAVARHTMERIGWYYYSSGADDEITLRENHRAFQRLWFRPKVLVDVSEVDFSTELLGAKAAAPFYITATALGKLGHEDGELCLTRAAAKHAIPQMVSTLSSCSIDEIMAAAAPGQQVWMQVYVNADREVTKRFIQHADKLGVTGFFVTVDAPQLGRREKDMRSKYDAELADVQEESASTDRSSGAARAISGFIDPALSWKDVPFLLSCTAKPMFVKGVQRWEDVVKAASLGFAGCVLSNHGGRQLEFSRSAIEILAETMPRLRERGLDARFDVYIDGGVRRGTDVLKALCLGAKAVGIGRPFLYAMSTYGEAGVSKAMRLLKDEIEMNMRLLGVTSLSELDTGMVDARSIAAHDALPSDYTTDQVYERLLQPQFKHLL